MSLSPDEVQHFSLRSRSAKADEPGSGLTSISVLLVEDNPADVGLVREALTEHGFNGVLSIISDGARAIRYIEDVDGDRVSCPNLVILDLNLPKRTGREVLARIRSSARCREVPVAILSSSDRKKDREEAVRLGANRYLRKPHDLEEFLSLGGVFKEMISSNPS